MFTIVYIACIKDLKYKSIELKDKSKMSTVSLIQIIQGQQTI